MTHRLSTLLIIACVVLFASCGEGHHAKRLVENFMKDDMGVADYSVVSWTKLDSTFRVNDSVLTSMHQQALSEKPSGNSLTMRNLQQSRCASR